MIPVVGSPAPKFDASAVVFENGAPTLSRVSLDSLLKDGHYAVLVFYPADFTFVCPTEIFAYANLVDKFKEQKANLVFISTDSEFSHLAWLEQPRREGGLQGITVPMLSDRSQKISASYGILEESGVAQRGTFIISDKGLVRCITINDIGIGRSAEETLRLVAACRFADEHGEVCPAHWNPEKAEGMKPTIEGSKEYFRAHSS